MNSSNENYAGFFGNGADAQFLRYINGIYVYMFFALLLTGATMYAVGQWQPLQDLMYVYDDGAVVRIRPLAWLMLFMSAGLAVLIHGHLARLSFLFAQMGFWLFSVTVGCALSVVFHVATGATMPVAILAAAGFFGGLALYNAVLKKDTGATLDQLLPVALTIFCVTIIANVFLRSPLEQLMLALIGVVIFIMLALYDANRLRNAYHKASQEGNAKRLSIWGALVLYTSLINIVLDIFKPRKTAIK